ncbi:MAG: PilZ domain-containing protein [Candidatus Omnitrophica bacterium]|nr:PilZ domain-containing protein [Candidatus Omnitrophota bacterium]
MERRRYKRVSGRLKIVYKAVGEKDEGSVYSMDVSAGGFCLGLDRVFKADTVLELLVYLPDKEKPFLCLGKVAWQKPNAVKASDGKIYFMTGLRFENLDLKNRLRLIYYVHGRAQAEPEIEKETKG